MFEEYQICPYTGLRSFTEEESLYFKGREEHIEQATEQLQRNKFLMLTGASGDGKSSLVYAGIVPNARAGFLKSKYTNWCVADFRPERSPFKNLSKAVAKQLNITNYHTVESELHHGFSALADLYRNSNRYIDVNSNAWQEADDVAKATLKREAGNLIILVDQFEEFFTNPENYHQGVPSRDSNLVLNLLLETARIALEEDLPIYVIFTMRSDFIGQCAAFRGLPEYIGFSQFFVPRLNRTQLQQVIEEPAVLSGNRITRRLAERLIHDIAEGVDQLPILQHALNQIWHAAVKGTEEMDLVHYAMVGGMPPAELPDEHIDLFTKWFDKLPEKVKACYHKPSLQNVLDTHANKLFESAAERYHNRLGKEISDETAKEIIKKTFICLTKIDQSRAVRNRMTLKEIWQIINRPDVDIETLGWVINIFREPGNTFVRPFITDEVESGQLKETDVLDITHESLIRNWMLLEQWAQEEYHDYSVSLDFEQQLNRWVDSGKSNGFLLSIGPLTFFENWYNKVVPNAYWIARYLPEDIEQEKKLTKAKQVLSNSQEFLKRSARKHVVTRTFMRYGAKRIAIALGIITILTLSSFVVRDYINRQNDSVLKSIHSQTISLANNPKVVYWNKIVLIGQEIKLGRTTIDEVINSVTDPVEKINVAHGIATLLIFQAGGEPVKETMRSLTVADSLLQSVVISELTGKQLSAYLKQLNQLRVSLELGYYYRPDPNIAHLKKRNVQRAGHTILHIINQQPKDFDDIQSFTLSLENAVNNQAFSTDEIKKLLNQLSPFESANPTEWVKLNFHRDKLLIRGQLDYGFKFNGLYQQLAYLYAASGNSSKALQCIDTLLAYSQTNYLGDYANGVDNATNIVSVFFLNSRSESELDLFVKGYCEKKKIAEEDFYKRVLGRTLHSYTTAGNLYLYWWMGVSSNINLQFSSRDQLSFFFSKYRSVIQSTIKDAEERNFLTALSYKNEGILKSLNKEEPKVSELSVKQSFDKAVELYRRLDSKYLNQTTSMIGVSGADQIIVPRKYLFIYPDLKEAFHPLEPRSFFFFYSTDVFLEYILDSKLFDEFYPTSVEFRAVEDWLRDYNSKMFTPRGFLSSYQRPVVFEKMYIQLSNTKNKYPVDVNWLYFYLGWSAQQKGDTVTMLNAYRSIRKDNILNTLRSKEFGNNINNQSFRLIGHAVQGFVRTNHFDEAYALIAVFKKPMNRSSLYAYAAVQLQREKVGGAIIQQLIDSAYVELGRIENLTTGQPHRQVLAYALTMQDPIANSPKAYQLIKNLGGKFIAMQRIGYSYSFHDELFLAMNNTPEFISDTDQAIFLWNILYGYDEGQSDHDKRWDEFKLYYEWTRTRWINYIDESS